MIATWGRDTFFKFSQMIERLRLGKQEKPDPIGRDDGNSRGNPNCLLLWDVFFFIVENCSFFAVDNSSLDITEISLVAVIFIKLELETSDFPSEP